MADLLLKAKASVDSPNNTVSQVVCCVRGSGGVVLLFIPAQLACLHVVVWVPEGSKVPLCQHLSYLLCTQLATQLVVWEGHSLIMRD